ncbi:hypothetical protein K438DRAFT_107257 [Mycena galopus ATCC 62051]|nr:hypothetical protein K438DRAFT_107257 [Mycena galopus ATCC 62051]
MHNASACRALSFPSTVNAAQTPALDNTVRRRSTDKFRHPFQCHSASAFPSVSPRPSLSGTRPCPHGSTRPLHRRIMADFRRQGAAAPGIPRKPRCNPFRHLNAHDCAVALAALGTRLPPESSALPTAIERCPRPTTAPAVPASHLPMCFGRSMQLGCVTELKPNLPVPQCGRNARTPNTVAGRHSASCKYAT